jgi:hypothetical protein
MANRRWMAAAAMHVSACSRDAAPFPGTGAQRRAVRQMISDGLCAPWPGFSCMAPTGAAGRGSRQSAATELGAAWEDEQDGSTQ